jgi:molybdopterin-guanine dinucleotide biosynthesis protein A
MQVSGIILAGGRGSRLGGVNKALLEIGASRNIDRVIAALRPLCSELLVVANDPALQSLAGVRVTFDPEPHAGVLPALGWALAQATGESAIAVACDMPFLSTALLRLQLERSSTVDVVMPVVDGRPEPLHAVYRRVACLSAIRESLAAGQQRLIAFLDRVRVLYLDEQELIRIDSELRSFFNTNTPEELEQARALAGGCP